MGQQVGTMVVHVSHSRSLGGPSLRMSRETGNQSKKGEFV